MDQDRESTKKKIILATIACIEKDGIHSVTTRNVAKEAEVNIAAINYYFGTKDGLLESTLNFTMSHFFDDLKIVMEHSGLNAYTLLKVLLSFILHGLATYPHLIKSLLFDPQAYGDYGAHFIHAFNSLLADLEERIKKEAPDREQQLIKTSLVQIFSAIITPGLPEEIFREFTGSAFTDSTFCRDYLTSLLDRYLTWVDPTEVEKQKDQADRLIESILNSDHSSYL